MDEEQPPFPMKQHLIDPEICIRCNTCEETCPVDAITHDDNNYVVDADKCNFCLDCISPCPTGSIDNWRIVMPPTALKTSLNGRNCRRRTELATSEAGNEALKMTKPQS